MPTIKGLMQEAAKGYQLMVVGPHIRWLETPEEERVYTDTALEFVVASLSGEFKKSRPGRISPSGIGDCQRRVVFSFAGAPALGENVDTHELFGLGNWGHLKWQAEGLSMGWLASAEAWTHRAELTLGGSADGILTDGSLFELKTVRSQIYSRIVSIDRAPKWENLLQVHAYMLLRDVPMASVVYESRDSGNFHEFRVPRDEKVDAEVSRRVGRLNDHIAADELPPMLDDCELRVGRIYNDCPYRKHCPTAGSRISASMPA